MSNKIGVNLNRFKKLVDNSEVPRQVIADFVGCDVSTITKHYNGDRNITVDYVIKYAEYFKVSSDYLLGLSSTPSTDKDIQFICDYTGLSKEALQALLRDKSSPFSEPMIDNMFSFFTNELISQGVLSLISLFTTQYCIAQKERKEMLHIAIKCYKDKVPDYDKKIKFLKEKIDGTIEEGDVNLFRVEKRFWIL